MPEYFVQIECCRFLPRREFYELRDLLGNQPLHFVEDIGVRNKPVPICIGVLVGPLKWVTPEVEHFWSPQFYEWLEPAHQLFGPLFHEHDFPVAHPDRQDVAVVTYVEEKLSRSLLRRPRHIWQQIVAIDMHFERLVSYLVALEELRDNVRVSRGS